MAQWNGQYTGNTHATRVRDLEDDLRHAVIIFRETGSLGENVNNGKSVTKLAKKLLAARLKFLKAKLYDAEPVVEESAKKQSIQVENLRQEIEKVSSKGIEGILIEFGVEDLIVNS